MHDMRLHSLVDEATQLILAGEPLPVDLEADLEGMGIMVDEFRNSLLPDEPFGFQLLS